MEDKTMSSFFTLRMLAMIALPAGLVGVVFGAVEPTLAQAGADPFAGIPFLSEAVQGSAVALLGWAVWYLLAKEIPKKRKEYTESLEKQQSIFTDTVDKLAERHERWETLRHEDSKRLDETLRAMTANCAAVQAENRTKSSVISKKGPDESVSNK